MSKHLWVFLVAVLVAGGVFAAKESKPPSHEIRGNQGARLITSSLKSVSGGKGVFCDHIIVLGEAASWLDSCLPLVVDDETAGMLRPGERYVLAVSDVRTIKSRAADVAESPPYILRSISAAEVIAQHNDSLAAILSGKVEQDFGDRSDDHLKYLVDVFSRTDSLGNRLIAAEILGRPNLRSRVAKLHDGWVEAYAVDQDSDALASALLMEAVANTALHDRVGCRILLEWSADNISGFYSPGFVTYLLGTVSTCGDGEGKVLEKWSAAKHAGVARGARKRAPIAS